MQIFLDGVRYESPAIRGKLRSIVRPGIEVGESVGVGDVVYITNNKETVIVSGQKYHIRVRFCDSDKIDDPVVFEGEAVGIPVNGGGAYLMVRLPTLAINEPDGPLWYLVPHVNGCRYECSYLGGLLWVQEMMETTVRGPEGDWYEPARFYIGYNTESFGGDIEIQPLREAFLLARKLLLGRLLELGQLAAEERDRMASSPVASVPPRYTLIE